MITAVQEAELQKLASKLEGAFPRDDSLDEINRRLALSACEEVDMQDVANVIAKRLLRSVLIKEIVGHVRDALEGKCAAGTCRLNQLPCPCNESEES